MKSEERKIQTKKLSAESLFLFGAEGGTCSAVWYSLEALQLSRQVGVKCHTGHLPLSSRSSPDEL